MRYLFAALALLALAGCADYDDAGYAYNGYRADYAAGYGGSTAYAPYGYNGYYYAQPPAYGSDNCGTPYQWRACPAW